MQESSRSLLGDTSASSMTVNMSNSSPLGTQQQQQPANQQQPQQQEQAANQQPQQQQPPSTNQQQPSQPQPQPLTQNSSEAAMNLLKQQSEQQQQQQQQNQKSSSSSSTSATLTMPGFPNLPSENAQQIQQPQEGGERKQGRNPLDNPNLENAIGTTTTGTGNVGSGNVGTRNGGGGAEVNANTAATAAAGGFGKGSVWKNIRTETDKKRKLKLVKHPGKVQSTFHITLYSKLFNWALMITYCLLLLAGLLGLGKVYDNTAAAWILFCIGLVFFFFSFLYPPRILIFKKKEESKFLQLVTITILPPIFGFYELSPEKPIEELSYCIYEWTTSSTHNTGAADDLYRTEGGAVDKDDKIEQARDPIETHHSAVAIEGVAVCGLCEADMAEVSGAFGRPPVVLTGMEPPAQVWFYCVSSVGPL